MKTRQKNDENRIDISISKWSKKKQKQNKKIILLLLLMSTVRKYELHWIFSEMADGRDVIKRRDTLFF